MKKVTIKGKLNVFQMEAAWFYIDLPNNKIPDVPRAGWGSVPITATVGKTSWDTSIFPMRKDHYFIPVKKQVRQKEDLFEGEEVRLSFVVRKK